MDTDYRRIIDVKKIGNHSQIDLTTLFKLAQKENLPKSSEDKIKRLLLVIDMQKDFMEGGALGVPNSKKDVENITKFIYKNMDKITNIMCSLDTHSPMQIFHPCWWVNKEGKSPEPYTIISKEDFDNKIWMPNNMDVEKTKEYIYELSKVGKKLCIWPYHCIQGTDGGTLENEFAKMVYFHSVARNTYNKMVPKGMDPYSEMYGIIKPEYSRTSFINKVVLDAIKTYDEVYIVGEASSHCVLESVKQIAEYFDDRIDITKRLTVLTDCTSPIHGYEEATIKEFKLLNEKYGVNFKKAEDVIL